MALAIASAPAIYAPVAWAGARNPAPSALVVLLPPSAPGHGDGAERVLQSIPALSLGLLSTAQGQYTQARMLQDIGRAASTASRQGRGERLAVVSLPGGRAGYSRLRGLVRRRPAGELVLVLERASAARAHELRWAALANAGAAPATLSSQTTRERGLIAAVDVAPTLLAHLRLPVSASMRGKPVHRDGPLDGAWLRSLKARLEAVYPRRLPALACLLAAWALLLAIACTPLLLATRPARLRWGLRTGALALLWAPVAVLLPAALEPGAAVEYALIVASSLALAALTDLLLPWPRAPVAPAVAAIVAICFDALAGTQLLMRSLLGPNPAYGSRFYGIGNELKPALAVLVLAAVAAVLYRATRSRRAAGAMAGAGALLAAVEGSAVIGAGVGGVVLVCAGTATAAAMLLPGALRRRRLLAVLAAPPLGLLLLAALDLATARGAGHFNGSVLQAHSLADLRDLLANRYRAAWRELGNGAMPLATAAAVLLAALAVRRHERLLAPVASDPGWQAALAGGLSAGVAGSLVEDSGPVLLVVALFSLACVLAYLWGGPQTRGEGALERASGSAVAAFPPQHDLVL